MGCGQAKGPGAAHVINPEVERQKDVNTKQMKAIKELTVRVEVLEHKLRGTPEIRALREENTKALKTAQDNASKIKALEKEKNRTSERVDELEAKQNQDHHEITITKSTLETLEKSTNDVESQLEVVENFNHQEERVEEVAINPAVRTLAEQKECDLTVEGLKMLRDLLEREVAPIREKIRELEQKIEDDKKELNNNKKKYEKCLDVINKLKNERNVLLNEILEIHEKISELEEQPTSTDQPGLTKQERLKERLKEVISKYWKMDESSPMSDQYLLEAIDPVDPSEKLEVILDQKHTDGGTALHVAADRNHEIMLDRLLNKLNEEQTCQLLNAQDNLGQTVFHRLAKKGFYETFDTLLQKVSIEKKLQTQTVRDKKGKTAILTAALSAQTQTVCTVINCLSTDDLYKLLSSTADDWTRQTFMHQFISSVTNPDVKIVNRISVQLGFDGWCKLLALTDYCGRTPLHVATSSKHVEITKEMIAVTETKNLVHLWRIADHSRCTAMQNAANPAHVTVLEHLAERLNSEQLFELLRFPYRKQETLIHILVQKNDSALLELLMGKMEDEHKRGILTITDESGFTPIHTAISCDHREILSILLKYLPPESEKTYNLLSKTENKFNDTDIHLAAEKGNIEDLELMLEKLTKKQKMALLNQQNDYKWTPHVAAKMQAKDKAAEWLEKTMESLEREGGELPSRDTALV